MEGAEAAFKRAWGSKKIATTEPFFSSANLNDEYKAALRANPAFLQRLEAAK